MTAEGLGFVRRGLEFSPHPGVNGDVPDPLELSYPFAGDWLVQNSPADRVPSHGTPLFATSHAIDFVPVDERGRSARITWRTLIRPEPPGAFPGFGRPITSPVDGEVVAVHDGQPDHEAHRGLPSVAYAFTQRQRVAHGWVGLAGNHVLVATASGIVVALCHLRRGSIGVVTGQRISAGDPIGACGNSGNSTEPHLHLQAMDGPDPTSARAVSIRFPDGMPRNGAIVSA